MPLLHIALQEGFRDDEVVVRVNGGEIFHKNHVTTRTQIGFADSIETEAGPGRIQVEFSLPAKQRSKTVDVDASAPLYLAVMLGEDLTITYHTSETPFRYA